MTSDQLFDHASEPARIDRGGIELPGGVRPEQQTDEQHGEIGVLRVASLAIGKPIEQRGELRDDLGVQRREALAQLRAAERGDANLGEQHAAVAIGGELDEQEVETARERVLGIEDGELGTERAPQILDDLIDGRDQQVFLGDEVVVDETRRQIGLGGDALHRGFGDAVLEDRGAQSFDDLSAARAGETRASHR